MATTDQLAPLVTDQDIDDMLFRIRRHYGTFVRVQDRGIIEGDAVQADVHGYVDDQELIDQDDFQFYAVNDASLFGFALPGLADVLVGAERFTEQSWLVAIPATHDDPSLRGKVLRLEFTIKDVRRLVPAALDSTLFKLLGVSDAADLKSAIREELRAQAKVPVSPD